MSTRLSYLTFNPSFIILLTVSLSVSIHSHPHTSMTPPISLQCLLFVSLMLQIHIWGSLTAHSLGHCGLVWKASDQRMGRWREGEQVDSAGIYQSCGRMWMQKQRRTSRLKKTCMDASEKASVVSLACLIPVTWSQQCLSGFHCGVYFSYLFSFCQIKQLTATCSSTCGEGGWGDALRPWTWHCPRNVYAVKGLVLYAHQSLIMRLYGCNTTVTKIVCL